MSDPTRPYPKKPDHVVKIHYEGDELGPIPADLKVKLHQSIRFEQGQIPAGHTMHVSFEHPEHFSAETYREGDEDIVVRYAIPKGEGKYFCKLVVDGVVQPPKIPGGSLELDTGEGATR